MLAVVRRYLCVSRVVGRKGEVRIRLIVGSGLASLELALTQPSWRDPPS